MPKARLILVTKNLPPDVGGMERLWAEAIPALSKYFQVIVIGPQKAKPLINGYFVFSGCPRNLFFLLLASTFKAFYLSLKYRPQVILAGSGVTAPAAYIAALFTRNKSACYVHGLDIIYPSILYQNLFIPFIKRVDTLISNSRNTGELIKQKLKREPSAIVNPGVQLHITEVGCDKQAYKKSGILMLGRIIRRKGIREFIQQCFPKLLEQEQNCHLYIVGESPPGINEKQQCEAISSQMGLNSSISFLGKLSNEQLYQKMSECAVHVFPAIEVANDVEGFGMVAIEAAAMGLPTVAFDCGGISDAVVDARNGFLVQSGDYHRLTNKILQVLQQGYSRESCIKFSKEFSWECFSKRMKNALSHPIT